MSRSQRAGLGWRSLAVGLGILGSMGLGLTAAWSPVAADDRSRDSWLGQWLERSRRPVENEQAVARAGSSILKDEFIAFAGERVLMEIETLTAAGQPREPNDTMASVGIDPFIAQRR